MASAARPACVRFAEFLVDSRDERLVGPGGPIRIGNKAFRAFVAEGHRVIPINPNEPSVEGVATYASVTDVPGQIDMATVYVPPRCEMSKHSTRTGRASSCRAC